MDPTELPERLELACQAAGDAHTLTAELIRLARKLDVTDESALIRILLPRLRDLAYAAMMADENDYSIQQLRDMIDPE